MKILLPQSKLQNLERHKAKVVLIGDKNVGKSSLINAIFEGKYDVEKADTNYFFSKTKVLKKHSNTSFPLVIYDTPGINQGKDNDIQTMNMLIEDIRHCDLILMLLPHQTGFNAYENTIEYIIEHGKQNLLRDRVVFAITCSDLILQKMKVNGINTIDEYKEKYCEEINDNIFKNNSFKLTPDRLLLTSKYIDQEIDELIIQLLSKVSEFGYFGMIEMIKKQRISLKDNFFFDCFFNWVAKLFSETVSKAIVNAFVTALFL